MKRNLVVAVLTPCILACILILLIVMDRKNSPVTANPPGVVEEEQGDGITPTEAVALEPSPTVTPVETITSAPTKAPTATPTSVPTKTPTQAPTPTATPTPTPTPIPTPLPTATPGTQPITPIPTPAGTENNGSPQNPDDSGKETNPEQGNSEDQTTQEPDLHTYEALYTQKAEKYTLVADRITKRFLMINNQDTTIRQTAFTYAPFYEETPGNFYGPVFGYKNGWFVFIAGNDLVASDGVTEKVLKTFGEDNQPDAAFVNPIVQSDNRFMAGIDGTLVVIDTRTLKVETYTEDYSVDFFVLTDSSLCFSKKGRVPAGPYFNNLYTAKDGKTKLLGLIGEIHEYVMDGDNLIIKSEEDLFQINLKTNQLTTSKQIGKEYTMYFPVYSPGIITGLKDIRFINYNQGGSPTQSIHLPASWSAGCYYNFYDSMPYYYYLEDKENAHLLPTSSSIFTMLDYSAIPLADGKYLNHSTVKKELYTGETFLGEGEIVLLEKYEEIYDAMDNKNKSIPYEIVYAWIPINGETRAYQFYLYVPRGKDMTDYFNLMKQLLKI